MIPNSCTVFTDGSSRGNPGPGGFGSIIILENPKKNSGAAGKDKNDGGRVIELGGFEERTTNNRMELTAAINALRYIAEDAELGAASIIVNSDSSYLINGITKWIKGWKKNGWRTSLKEEVSNRDLWEILENFAAKKKISWNYVGGHVGIAGNERCDKIATAFADGQKPALYRGPLGDYPIKNILDANSKNPAAVSSKQNRNNPPYSYVSEVGGIIQIHKNWADCQKRVSGKPARFRKVFSKNEEVELVALWKGENKR